ncbi:MAG: NFACT family protein [Acidobacteriota bacterium]
MTPGTVARLARELAADLAGRPVARVARPDAWSLGLEFRRGETLGFCWHPTHLAAGLCSWTWPRGAPEDVLRVHLTGARVEDVSAPFPQEPLLRVAFRGGLVRALVWEGLGRSGNLLLLDEGERVIWAGRVLSGERRSGACGSEWTPPLPRMVPPPSGEEDPSGLSERLRAGLLERGRAAALRALGRRAAALERRRQAILEDQREGEAWEAQEAWANALMASGDLRRRGLSSKRVTDFRTDPPSEAEVPLDPSKSVLENAEALFRKVRKAKTRRRELAERMRLLEEEARSLQTERDELAGSADLGRLFPEGERVRREPPPQRRRTLPPGVAQVALPLDFVGYAGKSAAGNDTVSFRLGRGQDFWFHASDYPGCHVVVRNPRRLDALPFPVEQAAAAYAAAHSGAPAGDRVAVTVARCHQLRRVPGALGRVTVASPRTLFVDLPKGR